MIKNIFLEISYDGSNYFGWQIQNNSTVKSEILGTKTVQGKVENALRKLFGENIRVIYAGRTDRGVHAKAQCVNFKIDTRIPIKNIKNALNAFLPDDIRIKKVRLVPSNFHARFSASSKIYRYIIFNRKEPSVFLNRYAWHIPQRIDIERMKKASLYLKGEKDFSCFAKEASKYKSCIRKMLNINIKRKGSYVYIDMEATGFLRNMARNIVMFLVRVSESKISLKQAKDILNKKIPYTNKPAPAYGLYLWKVKYE